MENLRGACPYKVREVMIGRDFQRRVCLCHAVHYRLEAFINNTNLTFSHKIIIEVCLKNKLPRGN